jgi:bacteriochlorophyll 4-vinyl reductase
MRSLRPGASPSRRRGGGADPLLWTAELLAERQGEREARRLLGLLGLESRLDEATHPPSSDEEFLSFLRLLEGVLPPEESEALLREAGRKTGLHLSRSGIPLPTRLLLRALPEGLSLRLFLELLTEQTLALAGTGGIRPHPGPPPGFVLYLGEAARRASSPALLRPYYCGAVQALLTQLVSPRASLREEGEMDPHLGFRLRIQMKSSPPDPGRGRP